MTDAHWSRMEVEVIVSDYLSMLASELSGTAYSKAAHRRAVLPLLNGRSEQAIEYKYANISAALLDAGFPCIAGYKRRNNYQALISEVLAELLPADGRLCAIAAADVDRPMVVPEVDDLLSILVPRPKPESALKAVKDTPRPRLATNYLEREARNQSLGLAGELLVVAYEQERLARAGKEKLAGKVEHTSLARGDHEGYDILSYELNGKERLIEVKTTKYGSETPFYVTSNEVSVSTRHADRYQLYRLYAFQRKPRLFTLPGAIHQTCRLEPTTYRANLL